MDDFIGKALDIRRKVISYHFTTEQAHLGGSLSCVEILTVLYFHTLKTGDMFILSKGHAASTLYVVLNDLGKIPDSVLFELEEHPTLNKDYGIEATTGSLGHGLSIALGMAIADREKISYVLMGDGECDEGQIWEAARLASELGIKNLTGIVDCNSWQGLKNTNHKLLDKRFQAFGWETQRCEGHDCYKLAKAFKNYSDKPRIILADTIKGKGIESIEDTLKSHYIQVK